DAIDTAFHSSNVTCNGILFEITKKTGNCHQRRFKIMRDCVREPFEFCVLGFKFFDKNLTLSQLILQSRIKPRVFNGEPGIAREEPQRLQFFNSDQPSAWEVICNDDGDWFL